MPSQDAVAAHIRRLLDIWSTATGQGTPAPQSNPTTIGYVRELGEYLGEAIYQIGKSAGGAAENMRPEQQVALEQGIIREWLSVVRSHPDEAMAVLAVLARILRAAIDGARASDRGFIEDAHEYAAKLEACLAANAGASGVVEEALRILANKPDRFDR